MALLVEHFSNRLASELGVPPLMMDQAEIRQLQAYPWPGNVRELKMWWSVPCCSVRHPANA
ncbi:MAG: hypothetical protein R3E89_08560 [Thiolinea sp.]